MYEEAVVFAGAKVCTPARRSHLLDATIIVIIISRAKNVNINNISDKMLILAI